MGSVDRFCSSMYHWSCEMAMRYGQGNDWFPLPRYDFSYGGSTDCSAMTAHCLIEAGYDVSPYLWSGNTAAALRAIGWTNWSGSGYPPRGSVLVNTDNHVAMTTGGGHIIEFGGDPAYGYVTSHGWYSYPWDEILAPPDDGDDGWQDEYDGSEGEGIVYEVHTEDGWLGPVSRVDDTEDGYAGWRGKPIDGIRAYRRDSSILRIQAIMDDGTEWTPTAFTGSMLGVNIDGDGYAGDIDSGHHIIGLRVFGAKCRVKAGAGWLGWTEGDNPTPEGDDFAGEDLWKKQPITAVQMML